MDKIIIMQNIIGDMKKYKKTFDYYYDIVFEDYEQRLSTVKIQLCDDKIITHPLQKFLVEFILLRPFVEFNKPITSDDYVIQRDVRTSAINKYFDYVILTFLNRKNCNQLSECIYEMTRYLKDIGFDFNPRIGSTLNLYDEISLMKRNKRYNEIIHNEFPPGLSSGKVEEMLENLTKEMIDILKEEENCFKDALLCGEGINIGQLTQYKIGGGPKPDLDGNVFPTIINSNLLTTGFKNLAEYYVDACGGRKAAIFNSDQVEKSGYTNRMLELVCSNTRLSKDIKDCGSTRYVDVFIDSEKTLDRFNWRYINYKGKLLLIKTNKEKFKKLIGKTVKMRSPITCTSKDGKVCKTCYGKLSEINSNVHIGFIGVHFLTRILTQILLSAKHLLKTNSEKIVWPERFKDFFYVGSNIIYKSSDLDKSCKIIIHEDDIIENENNYFDDDEDSKEGDLTVFKYRVQKFSIFDGIETHTIETDKELFLSNHLETGINLDNRVGDHFELNLDNFDFDIPLFYIVIENNELYKSMYDILNHIDKKDNVSQHQNLDEFFNIFLKLLNDGGISVNAVHVENIVREMVKDIRKMFYRPDFSLDEEPKYEIKTLTNAIYESPSLTTGLAFQDQKRRQIQNPDFHNKKEPGFFDRFF